jgi:cytochrome c oxidase cbb3-type subunit III
MMSVTGRIYQVSAGNLRGLPVAKSKMRAGLILPFSRDYLRTAAVAVFLAVCPFVVHSRAQGTSPPPRKSPVARPAAESGKKTFESVCAACHGLDGRGGERGPNIATRAEVQGLTDEETLHILQSGIPAAGMPAFGALGPPKIKAVMGYLRILQGGSQGVFIPGNAQRGNSLFFGAAGCAKCHMINGAGGFLGADLSSYASKASIEDIRSAITDPNKDLDPQARTVLVTTREGRRFTGIARNEDNFSLQLQSLDGTFHLLLKSDLKHLEYEPKSLMPSDYGSVLSPAELDDLVKYLFSVARTAKQPQASGKKSKCDEEHQ